jgi:PAS domain S-box-containing protein
MGSIHVMHSSDILLKETDWVRHDHQELARVTARLDGIIASAMDAIISVDEAQRVMLFNPAAERMFGISAADAMGQHINRFIPERFRTAHTRHVKDFGRTGVSNRRMGALGTLSGLRANGQEFPIEASISQVQVAGAKIFTVILRDISEALRAQEELRKQARLIDLAPAATIVRGLDGTITFWSRGAESLYGWSKEEALGRRTDDLLRTEFPEPFAKILALIEDRGRWSGELRHQTKDGRWLTVQSHWLGQPTPASGLVEILESNVDVTQRNQLRDRLEEAVAERTARLREANAELEAFSYSLSHDMRGPLRAILGYTEIAVQDLGSGMPTGVRDYLDKVMNAAHRLDRLIRDVLAFSRLSRQPVERRPIDLQPLLQGIIRERPELQEPRAEVRVESPLPMVLGDEASLTQCLTNLLDNAVKFVTANVKPQVRVWAEDAGAIVRVWIADNGIGIPASSRERVFKLFERNNRSSQYEGTGVGLAIVRKAVERMGGEVGVESEEGRGSRFWLELTAARK